MAPKMGSRCERGSRTATGELAPASYSPPFNPPPAACKRNNKKHKEFHSLDYCTKVIFKYSIALPAASKRNSTQVVIL